MPPQLFGTTLHGSDIVELERRDDLAEELDFLRGGVDERYVEVGTNDLEGETRETRRRLPRRSSGASGQYAENQRP